MEIILAIVVASAVIFFGALISMGNERQRKAIDGLKEQVVLWAVQDLKVKRTKLAENFTVRDPIAWFNEIIYKIQHQYLNIKIVEFVSESQSLICISKDNRTKVVITPFSPHDIKKMKRRYSGRLSQYSNQNPLLSLPHNTTSHLVTILDGGMFFDLELQSAWRAISNNEFNGLSQIWIYFSPTP